jgi:hypothetical protein
MLTQCAIAIMVAALVGTLSVGTEAWARGGGGRGKAHGMSWGGKGISRTPARVAAFQNRVAFTQSSAIDYYCLYARDSYIYSYPWDDRPSALAYARPA